MCAAYVIVYSIQGLLLDCFVSQIKKTFCLFLRLVGRPGKYLYVVGSYRMEEVMHTKKNQLEKIICI